MFCLDLTETEMTIVIIGAAVLLLAIILGIVLVHRCLRKKAIKAIKARCAELKSRLEAESLENNTLSMRCDDLKSLLEAKTQEKNDLSVRCADLEKDLAAKLQENSCILARCAEVENHLETVLQENNNFSSRYSDLEKELAAKLQENSFMSVSFANVEKHLETVLQEKNNLSSRCADVEKRLDAELQEKNDLVSRCADVEKRMEAELLEKNDLSVRCADVEKRLDAELQEKNDLVSRCADVEKRMGAELLEKNNLSVRCADLEKRLLAESQEKYDLSVRVSELISSRVNENKSDITDLNDEFRSEKLGEMSAELYDNEWTDAFDELTEKGYSKTEAIQRLLDIVMTTYYLCRNSAEEKWMIVLSWITNVGQDNIRQVLQHGRKAEAVRNMHSYQSKIADTLTNNCRDEMLQPLMSAPGPVRLYLEACIELCLLMVFHDPPLVWKCPLWVPATFSGQKVPVSNEPPTTETNLNNKVADNPIVMTEERHQLNKQIFKTYMNAGTWIEFIVWPALMHQNNKQIVRKGVAQGRE